MSDTRIISHSSRRSLVLSKFGITAVQSLLVWKSPLQSLVVLTIVNIAFWILYRASSYIIAYISWGCLLVYLIYIWKVEIWPVIKVPSQISDDNDWVPVDSGVLSVPELSGYCAEGLLRLELLGKALLNLKRKRRRSFLVLMWLASFILLAAGRLFSGFAICYILALQPINNWLKAWWQNKGQGSSSRCDENERSEASDRNRFATSEPVGELRGPEAIPVGIESEVSGLLEYNGADVLSITRDQNESDDDGASELLDSLMPDVQKMPDVENFYDDANSLMLETDLMPSVDDVDRSLLPTEKFQLQLDDSSEAESLPLDDLPTEPVTTQSSQAASMVGSFMANMAASVVNSIQINRPNLALEHQVLLEDPRDRVGDASIVEEDSSDEFEFISKDDLDYNQ